MQTTLRRRAGTFCVHSPSARDVEAWEGAKKTMTPSSDSGARFYVSGRAASTPVRHRVMRRRHRSDG